MPESLLLTTTFELPVVISHACGAATFCSHHCCGNSGSLGVTAKSVRFSSGSSNATARLQGRLFSLTATSFGSKRWGALNVRNHASSASGVASNSRAAEMLVVENTAAAKVVAVATEVGAGGAAASAL